MKPSVIIVSGWRDWPTTDAGLVENELALLKRAGLIGLLVDGACTGVDQIAHDWALGAGVDTKRFPADWSIGKSAGPERNREMLDWAKSEAEERAVSVCLLAFPGATSRGTKDCIEAAKERKIEVITHPYPGVKISKHKMPTGECYFCKKEDELWPFYNVRHCCPTCWHELTPKEYL